MPHDIEILDEPEQFVAATQVRTNLQRIGQDVGAGFGTLMQAIGQQGAIPDGPPLVIYLDEPSEEHDGDVEICIPIDGPVEGSTDVYGRQLEGGPMASTVHVGPYDELGGAYEALMTWIAEHGHQVVGPPREIYLNDPDTASPEQLQTRVEFPIRLGAG